MPGEDEQFSQEELEILGEETEEEDSMGEEESEETQTAEGEGEEESEQESDEEGETSDDTEDEGISSEQKRINELTFEKNENARKLDLFKRLGPDEYYKVYPDEKPSTDDDQPGAATIPDEDKVLTFQEAQGMVVQGGRYDGKSLGDLWRSGDKDQEAAAIDLYNKYRDEQTTTINDKKAKEDQYVKEAEQEINNFSAGIAKNLFEKGLDDLSREQGSKVDEVVNSVLDWMKNTGRGHYKLEDAFAIMKMDDLIAGAKSEGAKALIKTLKSGSTPSVNANKGGGGKKTGYEAYEGMSAGELLDKIGAMPDGEYLKFIKNAPQSFKEKYPDIDWS